MFTSTVTIIEKIDTHPLPMPACNRYYNAAMSDERFSVCDTELKSFINMSSDRKKNDLIAFMQHTVLDWEVSLGEEVSVLLVHIFSWRQFMCV